MKKQNYLCVDVTTYTNKDMKVFDEKNGKLQRDEADHFTFVETHPEDHTEHPELHWRLLDRTKHGRVSINARHVKVEFYIRHEDYADGRDLADILFAETDTMGDNMSVMNMAEEIKKCVA